MNRKYELLKDDCIQHNGRKLYRIRALRDFGGIKAGDLGGHIESEANLSQTDLCWVNGQAAVFGDAQVSERAQVQDKAKVFAQARVYGDALIDVVV